MEKNKIILVDAYVRLGCAQGDWILQKRTGTDSAGSTATPPPPPTLTLSVQDIDDTLIEVQKLVDLNDPKVRYTFTHSFLHLRSHLLSDLNCNNFVRMTLIIEI